MAGSGLGPYGWAMNLANPLMGSPEAIYRVGKGIPLVRALTYPDRVMNNGLNDVASGWAYLLTGQKPGSAPSGPALGQPGSTISVTRDAQGKLVYTVNGQPANVVDTQGNLSSGAPDPNAAAAAAAGASGAGASSAPSGPDYSNLVKLRQLMQQYQINPKKEAAKAAALAFNPQLAQENLSLAETRAQGLQDLKDIGAWYGQLARTQGGATLADVRGGKQALKALSLSNAGALAAIGGGSNDAAGMVGAAGTIGRTELASQAAGQNAFDRRQGVNLAAQGNEARVSAKNATALQAFQLMQQLAQTQSQKGAYESTQLANDKTAAFDRMAQMQQLLQNAKSADQQNWQFKTMMPVYKAQAAAMSSDPTGAVGYLLKSVSVMEAKSGSPLAPATIQAMVAALPPTVSQQTKQQLLVQLGAKK